MFIFSLQAWFPGLFEAWNFGGSWSLSVEAFFYTLFPKLRVAISRLANLPLRIITFGIPALIALVTLGMLVSYSESNNTSKMFYVLPIFRLPEFIFGICGYVLFVERGLDRKRLTYVSLLFFICLIVAIYWRDLPGLTEWGSLASFTFMGIFVFSLKLDAPQIVKKIINYLGHISYCVYMAQFTTIPVIKHYKNSLSLTEEWVLAITSTIVIAILTYHFVEVLAYKRTRKIAFKASSSALNFLQNRK